MVWIKILKWVIKEMEGDLIQRKNNKSALGLMLIAVMFYSTAPIVFAIGNASEAPFLFVALMNFSTLISGLVFLVWFHRAKRKNQTVKETFGVIYSKIFTKGFLWVLIGGSQNIFFAMSLAYINVGVAAILLAAKPFFVVVIIAWLFKEVGRYQKITADKWGLFVLAFIGAGLVVASRSESFGAIVGDLLNQGALVGISLVMLAALTGGAGTPFSLKLGNDISKKTGGGANDELFFTMAILAVSWVINVVLYIILGYAANESVGDINIYPAIIFGALIVVGVTLSRLANIKTDNLGVNALTYAIPVIGLIWLGLASLIDVPHFDWLVMGASGIVVANLLLNLEGGVRGGYKVGVVGGWFGCVVIYLSGWYQLVG